MTCSRTAAILGVLGGFITVPANADLTFAEWAKGPPDKRVIYTAGVVETVGVYAEALGFVEQWKKCLQRSQLSYGAVGEGALAFAKKHGNMDHEPAPGVIVAYINEPCGLSSFRR
jgi:hypothetical protein